MSRESREKKIAKLQNKRDCLIGLYHLAYDPKVTPVDQLDNVKSLCSQLYDVNIQLENLERAKKKRQKLHEEEVSVPEQHPFLRIGSPAHKRKRKHEILKELSEQCYGIFFNARWLRRKAESRYHEEVEDHFNNRD